MSGDKVISATAIIDVQDRASAKIVALSKKFTLITDAMSKAGTKTSAFNALDRSLSKVAAGADKAAKSVTGLEKGLSAVGSRSQSAGTGAAQTFDRIARSATTAEVALLRYARAHASANSAMSRAGSLPRPSSLPVPPPQPRRAAGTPPGAPPRRDRYGNLIEAGVGVRVAEGAATRAAKAGAELERQRVDATAAGLNEHEAAEVETTALDLSRKYKTVPQSALMRMMRNARAATGDLEDALTVMDPLTKLRVLAQAKHPGTDVSEEFETLVKGMEIKGVAQDRAEFTRYMDGMAKAMNVFGEQVKPSAYYQMFKYGRGSTRGLSEDYMLSVAPTLAAELGGSSTGVAGQAFYQAIVGRRLKKSSLVELEGLGLLDQGKVERDKKGQPVRVGVGGVIGADLARADPYRWVNEVMLPVMAKRGITDPNQIGDHIAAIFGNSLAQQLVSILATQQPRIEKDRKNLGKAQGLDAADEYLARDPGQALSAFTSQLENLLANASSPLMPAATAALNGLATALGGLSKAAKDHPVAAGGGLLAGIGGLAAGSAWFVGKALEKLGFGEGAAGGGTFARGLRFVAKWGKRATVPAIVTEAIVSAIVAGYDAADDTGRQHPYGKPGEAWDRRRRDNLGGAEERRRREAREATQRRAFFDDKRRREQSGLSGFMGPLMPEETTASDGSGGNPPGVDAIGAPMPGSRPRADAIGDVAPAAGGVGGSPSGSGVAPAIQATLSDVAAKIAEALNGHAEVAVKIEASPDFVARIVRLTKQEALGALNLTGPGSTGRDGANVDQHQ